VPTAVGLVPARSGSERVPGKNVLSLGGHPLIAYSIAAAQESGIFDAVVVSTDSEEIAEIARRYGAEVPGLRPAEMSTPTSYDIEWVLHVMRERDEEIFALLRPTSPFRTAATIRRAFERLVELGDRADSIRAVEPVRQHPGKMWTTAGDLLEPLLPQPTGETPLHSRQYQALPQVYAQNSSLELAWSRVLHEPVPTISGRRVAPFFTEGAEGFSIDYPDDVERAEQLAAGGKAALPRVATPTRAVDDELLRRAVRVSQPLLLISQAQRSGGTLLLRLLDGHPECHVAPFQLRGIDQLAKNAPTDPEEVWQTLYDPKLAERFRSGHRQRKRDVLRDEQVFPFELPPELQREIYDACSGGLLQPTTRDLLDCYFTSYFNAWQNYGNLRSEPKRWVVGFEPGVARSMRRADAVRNVFNDGKVISIFRDPWSWYASASRWEPRWKDREHALNYWCKITTGTLKWRVHAAGSVRLVKFEDLLTRTDETMRRLASWLELDFTPGLLEPTFNGDPIGANTSFSDVATDVSTKPLDRADEELDAATVAYIEVRAGDLYRKLDKRYEQDWRPS
jgi:CMP-N,N'-diacetyllegionaminic acid synthase